MQFSHDAMCPEISPVDCEQIDIIDHQHHQSMMLMRVQPSFSIGMGNGWQTMLRVPFDVKVMRIEYTDMSGNPYEPPYGNIHHRNETLTGLGDGELEFQRFWALKGDWVIGGGFGSMLPLGRTEKDPYIRASQSLEHQHMQMGGGTFDPIMSFAAVWSGHQWGMTVHSKGRLALYENPKEYRPSPSLQLGLGPTYRFTSKLMMTSDLSAQHDWQAEWAGEPDPMSGRTAFTMGASVIHRFNPTVAIMGQARVTLFQWSSEYQILQRFIGTVGVSVTPPSKKE